MRYRAFTLRGRGLALDLGRSNPPAYLQGQGIVVELRQIVPVGVAAAGRDGGTSGHNRGRSTPEQVAVYAFHRHRRPRNRSPKRRSRCRRTPPPGETHLQDGAGSSDDGENAQSSGETQTFDHEDSADRTIADV